MTGWDLLGSDIGESDIPVNIGFLKNIIIAGSNYQVTFDKIARMVAGNSRLPVIYLNGIVYSKG
jgi:hypothetical protein